MIPASIKRWLAFGSGVGIQITGPRGCESLRISAVRVRPSGAQVIGGFAIEDFPHQPAGVWGTDYAAFVRKLGLQQAAATVVLPRQDVIVRQLALPGVSDRDLAGAVQFQLEGLHPYPENEVILSWTRLAGTSTVLVVIAIKEAVDRYSALFTEAGIRIGGFTCSAAAVYSALRMFGLAPAPPLLAFEPEPKGGLEVYGESAARPLFSAHFDVPPERALSLAGAELRTEQEIELKPLGELLGSEKPLPYAAALVSACPRLSLPVNLLPEERRYTSSPMAWIPAAALGATVLLLAGALAAFPKFEERRYSRSLDAELARLQPAVARSAAIDAQIASAQRSAAALEDFRRRSKADLDVLLELTRLLPPPTWLNLVELNDRQVVIAGETDQAAPLVRVLDASPLFAGSEFAMPPMRIAPQKGPDGTMSGGGEAFRIRTNREALSLEPAKTAPAAPPSTAPPAAPPLAAPAEAAPASTLGANPAPVNPAPASAAGSKAGGGK
jgi:hypothetical protein